MYTTLWGSTVHGANCPVQDGNTPNDKPCTCGDSGTYCTDTEFGGTAATGLHCYGDDSLCSGPVCAVTDGSSSNPTECKCGSVGCTKNNGLICYATTGSGSCRKTVLGAFGFTKARLNVEGFCNAVSGRGLLSDPESCAAAAYSLGLTQTGDQKDKFPGLRDNADRYGLGCTLGTNNFLNFVPPTAQHSAYNPIPTDHRSKGTQYSICAVAKDCSIVDGKSQNDTMQNTFFLHFLTFLRLIVRVIIYRYYSERPTMFMPRCPRIPDNVWIRTDALYTQNRIEMQFHEWIMYSNRMFKDERFGPES